MVVVALPGVVEVVLESAAVVPLFAVDWRLVPEVVVRPVVVGVVVPDGAAELVVVSTMVV